jgi:uncharacterized membrane protein
MFTKSRTDKLKDNAATASEFAAALAKDKKFRKELLSAVSHGTLAQKRAARKIGFHAATMRLKNDPKIRRELNRMVSSLDKAWARVEKKRSHKVRNTLLIVGGVGGAVAVVVKTKAHQKLPGMKGGGTSPRTIDASIEVNVPVTTAYNQWTQFEDFPLFMEGVDHVQQLDSTRLHWAATVAGRKAEWDAKILEQHPDRQISWISEDGKKTRGTVSFEPRGEDKSLVRLSMSYQADPFEQIGSAAGLDTRRVRGDLERFKELIEARGTESGAWRGEVEAGQTKA